MSDSTMEERLRREYLAAMGIDVWLPRESTGSRATEQISVVVKATDRVQIDPLVEDGPPDWLNDVPPLMEEWAPTELPEVEQTPRESVAHLDWPRLAQRVAECTACELHAGRQQTVFGVGNRAASLMVIGEAPGAEEDRQGEPFVGRAGQLLNAMLLAIGLRRDQVYIANILKCRPPGNRDPRPEEALKCEPFLLRQLALVQPKVILAVGRIAAQNLLKSQESVGSMRGKTFRFEGIPFVVSYHPAYLLRSPEQKAKAWQDLQQVANLLKA